MNKLTVKLKQHTPLIHFQHNQEGATLRASEVKPKLDRFIFRKLGNNDMEKGKTTADERGWMKTQGALAYKMTFRVNEVPKTFNNNEVQRDRQGNIQTSIRNDGRSIKKLRPYPLFFGNMNADIDDPSEYKRFSMLNNPFYMEIFSFDKDLLDYLEKEKIWAEFFQTTNFGTRQSKGFGSFYIHADDPCYDDIDLLYRFSVDTNSDNKNWIDLFETIDTFYKSLRSGINICWGSKFYMKPVIFKYAQERKKDWDKKLIKQAVFDNVSPAAGNDYLFKDLLGLSSDENWKSYNTSMKKENRDHDKIDRFPSPIFIKPIEEDGYFNVFVDSDINTAGSLVGFLNKSFHITSKRNRKSLILKTYPEFDIDDFLKFAFLKNDLSDLTDDVNHDIFLLLKDIYNEIRREHE
jgi:hypothetical protein